MVHGVGGAASALLFVLTAPSSDESIPFDRCRIAPDGNEASELLRREAGGVGGASGELRGDSFLGRGSAIQFDCGKATQEFGALRATLWIGVGGNLRVQNLTLADTNGEWILLSRVLKSVSGSLAKDLTYEMRDAKRPPSPLGHDCSDRVFPQDLIVHFLDGGKERAVEVSPGIPAIVGAYTFMLAGQCDRNLTTGMCADSEKPIECAVVAIRRPKKAAEAPKG